MPIDRSAVGYSAEERLLGLRCYHGSSRVPGNVNLFALSTDDRNFVIDLVDKLKGYDVVRPSEMPLGRTLAGKGSDTLLH